MGCTHPETLPKKGGKDRLPTTIFQGREMLISFRERAAVHLRDCFPYVDWRLIEHEPGSFSTPVAMFNSCMRRKVHVHPDNLSIESI